MNLRTERDDVQCRDRNRLWGDEVSSRQAGFTLVEVLVALAIAGALLLSAAGLYWQQKEIGQRLIAERAADEALENAYESLRVAAPALGSADLPGDPGSGVTLTISVTPGPVARTRALDIVATYRVHGRAFPAEPAGARPRPGGTVSQRRRHEAGFTLVEILVSMLVLLVVLMVTNGLLAESLRIFSNSGRELREPGVELALRLLREDVHAAQPFAPGLASHLGLPCQRTDRIEVWEMDEDRLVRRTYDPDWTLRGTRPMLDRMVGFSWSTDLDGTVNVALVRRKPAGASALRVATAAWKSAGETLEAAHVVVGSRIGRPPG